IMVDESNYGCLLLSECINLATEEKSKSWFFTYGNWPWSKQYHVSPFRLLYLNYIINRDFISKTPFNFDTIVNISEIIVGYTKYTILYYWYIIFPIWLFLLFSSIIYKRRKRKKEYDNFKKQFPPDPPSPPTNE
ncbi:MAG: hypothetical protein K2J74_00740, partial [Muribaculaceae bacterium]|nr:hypothetical protein [Muribaculaceae bacterium]